MISLQRSMHSSQMYTPGPAISFLTCFWLFPQKEHFSRSPPSPMRAMNAAPVPSGTPVRCACRDGTRRTPRPGSVGVLRFGDASVGGRRRGRAAPTGCVVRCQDNPATGVVGERPGRAGARAGPRHALSADGGELPALDDLVDDPVLLGLRG